MSTPKDKEEVLSVSISNKGRSGYYHATITGNGTLAGFPLIPGVLEGHSDYIEKEFGINSHTSFELLSFLESYAINDK